MVNFPGWCILFENTHKLNDYTTRVTMLYLLTLSNRGSELSGFYGWGGGGFQMIVLPSLIWNVQYKLQHLSFQSSDVFKCNVFDSLILFRHGLSVYFPNTIHFSHWKTKLILFHYQSLIIILLVEIKYCIAGSYLYISESHEWYWLFIYILIKAIL